MKFEVKSKEELMELGFSAISDDFDKSENSFIHQAISAAAIMAHELEIQINYVYDMQYLDRLKNEDLDMYVFDRTGLERKKSTYAKGNVTFYGSTGTYIPMGTKVSNGNDVLKTIYGDVIENNYVTIEVEALESGDHGSYPSNTITALVDSISGVERISNEDSIASGSNSETDNSLRARYRAYMAEPATTNNPAQFRKWAREVANVGQARVIRAFNGAGTIQLIILNRNYLPADAETLNRVRENIEKQYGFDVKELSVIAPTAIKLNLNLRARYANDLEKDHVKERIKENIRNYLKNYPDPDFVMKQVSYWDIAVIVKNTNGIIDIENLSINGSQENIMLNEKQVAEMGEIIDT